MNESSVIRISEYFPIGFFFQNSKYFRCYRHFRNEKPPLSDEVLEVVRRIYANLSLDELLDRFLGANTQNNTENLNSLI